MAILRVVHLLQVVFRVLKPGQTLAELHREIVEEFATEAEATATLQRATAALQRRK